jgi:hypothetical protein
MTDKGKSSSRYWPAPTHGQSESTGSIHTFVRTLYGSHPAGLHIWVIETLCHVVQLNCAFGTIWINAAIWRAWSGSPSHGALGPIEHILYLALPSLSIAWIFATLFKTVLFWRVNILFEIGVLFMWVGLTVNIAVRRYDDEKIHLASVVMFYLGVVSCICFAITSFFRLLPYFVHNATRVVAQADAVMSKELHV